MQAAAAGLVILEVQEQGGQVVLVVVGTVDTTEAQRKEQ
jgi:hypothetical protein